MSSLSDSFSLTTSDGLELHGASNKPAGEPKAAVVLIHGMGEHFGRYGHVVSFLTSNGFGTIGVDLRGHGRSGGKRGHSPSYEHLMDDLSLLLKKAIDVFPNQPIFLYGHSMGGNLAANFVVRRKPALRGLVLSAPYFKLAFQPPWWKLSLSKLIAGIFPALTLPTELELAALSRDENVVAAYKSDPLVHDRISAAFFTAVHSAGTYPAEHAAELPVPTLVMHGTADRLTSATAAKEFAVANPGKITLKLWEGFYHEIHNETEQIQVLRYMANWMENLL